MASSGSSWFTRPRRRIRRIPASAWWTCRSSTTDSAGSRCACRRSRIWRRPAGTCYSSWISAAYRRWPSGSICPRLKLTCRPQRSFRCRIRNRRPPNERAPANAPSDRCQNVEPSRRKAVQNNMRQPIAWPMAPIFKSVPGQLHVTSRSATRADQLSLTVLNASTHDPLTSSAVQGQPRANPQRLHSLAGRSFR